MPDLGTGVYPVLYFDGDPTIMLMGSQRKRDDHFLCETELGALVAIEFKGRYLERPGVGAPGSGQRCRRFWNRGYHLDITI